MAEKELRRMSREELVEIIYAMQQSQHQLEQQNEELRARLDDRTLKWEQAGSLAEAALSLNHVFEDAQAAADQYLASLKAGEADARAKADETWMDACRAETVKLQQGDPENRALWQDFIRMSRHTFDEIYDRLGISFETTRGESYYQPQLAAMVERLEKAGLAHESRGAVVVDLRDLDPAFAEQSRKAVEAALAKNDAESAAREDGT